MTGEETAVVMNVERFRALWRRCSQTIGNNDVDEIHALLIRHYGESWRRYHTQAHLQHCLKYFDKARAHMESPDEVEMALWFHDAVYDVRGNDNELMSAQLFTRAADGFLTSRCLQRVFELIMITEHCDPPSAGDERYIVDIDLSSFGLPWDEFSHDSANVRAEFPHLDDDEYNRRQLKFFRHLLSRPHFYASEFFRERYEKVARANLARRMAELAAMGY